MVAKGERGGNGMDWEFGVSRCKLLHLEWISNEVLLYSTENYIYSLWLDHDGSNIRKEMCVGIYMCVCVYTCIYIHICVYI